MGIYTFKMPNVNSKDTHVKWIEGGFVVQSMDNRIEKSFSSWKTVTKKKPTKLQMKQMKIGWLFISRVRSNSILVMDPSKPMTRGIGSGQTSRIKSAEIALQQAGEYANGSILVSDSFFPFDDNIKLAAKHGITAIVQQGGSINDKASIEAADKAGIAMVFTNRRAFWH
jgi:phosphoribosylaminoimidazolecarboxamide formyltransferase/IMP cyclohydrolase